MGGMCVCVCVVCVVCVVLWCVCMCMCVCMCVRVMEINLKMASMGHVSKDGLSGPQHAVSVEASRARLAVPPVKRQHSVTVTAMERRCSLRWPSMNSAECQLHATWIHSCTSW